MNINVNKVMYLGNHISSFTVNAPTGIGYAFWIKVDYRKNHHRDKVRKVEECQDDQEHEDQSLGIDINLGWHKSDRGPSVSVWQTKSLNLKDIPGLEKGMEVRLDIEVRLGSDSVPSTYSFYYDPESDQTAYYEAHGTSLNASVKYIDCRKK